MIRINRSILFSSFLICISAFFLIACDLHQEGHLTPHRLQVEQKHFSEQKSLTEIDQDYMRGLGKYYSRYGDGPVALSVIYDPKSRKNTAMKAGNELARLTQSFRKNGMPDLEANIIPVQQHGDDLQVLVSFTSYTAKPPKDCSVMAGTDNTEIEIDEDYRLGCTIETVFSKQIARPKDLRGQGQEDVSSDGRRATNIIDIHRTGTPNEPLGGESASGN